MRLVVTFLLMLAAAPAWADWVKVDESAERAYYIDSASIRKTAQTAKVWTIQDLKIANIAGGRSRRALQEFDCAEPKDRILSISAYSWSMARGTVLFEENRERPWRPTTPGTVNDRIRGYVCGR